MCASRVIGGNYTKLATLMGDPNAAVGTALGLTSSLETILTAPAPAPAPGGLVQ